MLVKEHPEVIEGRQRLITVDVIDSEDADEYAYINNYGATLDEEYGSGLVGAGVTEEVKDMQKAVKYSSILSYMLKPYRLITHGFEKNRVEQEKLLKHR